MINIMKKTLIVLALAAALSSMTQAYAQSYTRNRVGAIAGFTSSSAKISDVDAKSISLYHIGLTAELPVGLGVTIQPSLLYQMKGMSLDSWKNSTGTDIKDSFETKVGYLELPVQIQWGPDLLAFRPYGFLEPFVGYKLTDSSKGESAKVLSDELKNVEYGLGAGVGIDIWMLQFSAKYFWNFGDIYHTGSTATQTIKGLKDGNNFNGIAVSVAIMF